MSGRPVAYGPVTPGAAQRQQHTAESRIDSLLWHASSWSMLLIPAVIVGLVFFGLLTRGSFSIGHRVGFGIFYEAQARALLHGHLDIPPAATAGEAIVLGGRSYGYFGIVPAVLRLPLMLFYPHGFPYLAPWYFLAAYALEAAAAIGLVRWARRHVTHRSRWSSLLEVAFLVAVLGSASLQLSVRSYMYEEAILWGVAFGLSCFWALLRLVESSRPIFAVLAVAAAIGALGSRQTIGIGCVVAVAGYAVVLWRRSRGLSLTLAAGSFAAVVSYALVNELKFHTIFTVPLEHHIVIRTQPARLALVRAGAIAPRYVPTNLIQYLRPDTLHFTGSFPWVDFRMPRYAAILNIGGVRFDGLFPNASITSTMPLLVVLAFVGVLASFRSDRSRLVLIGAGAVAVVLTLGFFGEIERYLADFVPVLAVGAALALPSLLRRRGGDQVLIPGAALGVAVASLFVNFSLTLNAQRIFNGPSSILGAALPLTAPQPVSRRLLAALGLVLLLWAVVAWWVRVRHQPAPQEARAAYRPRNGTGG
jgi:hypothetical protein